MRPQPIVRPTQLRFQASTSSPIGGISMAGFIRESDGVPPYRRFGRYALVYVIDGQGHYADQRGFTSPVRCGDLLLIFPEIPHAYGAGVGQRWSEYYITFEGSIFDASHHPGLLDVNHPILHLNDTQYWLRRLQAIVEPGSDLTLISRMQQFLADVFDHQRQITLGPIGQRWLTEAQQLMNALETDPPLYPQAAAQRMGMSYESFRKKFTLLAGLGPAKYRDARLTDLACRLLSDHSFSLRRVADRCGFCDEFHFSRRFKQKIGLSPTEFRKRLALVFHQA